MNLAMPDLKNNEWMAITLTPEEAQKILPLLYDIGYSWGACQPSDLDYRLQHGYMISVENGIITTDKSSFYTENKYYRNHHFKFLTFQDFIQKDCDFNDLGTIINLQTL